MSIWNYRVSWSNATFGSGKNSHQPKFALAKYLPYANFGLFYFISAIFLAIVINVIVMPVLQSKLKA